MASRQAIYGDACSQLHDKKISQRDHALTILIPHLINCPEIEERYEAILDSLHFALEKGCNVPQACIGVERVVALNPLVSGTRSLISALINMLPKQLKDKQYQNFSCLFRCIGWCLCFMSTFNPDHEDLSKDIIKMFMTLISTLKYDSKRLVPYYFNLLAGIICSYLALAPQYRAGWGYDLFISVLLFFMTKNYDVQVTGAAIPICIDAIMIALKSRYDPKTTRLYPEDIVSQYQHLVIDSADLDDGYYLPHDDAAGAHYDAGNSKHDDLVLIPIHDWSFEELLARIELIFDADSITLDNDYSDEQTEHLQRLIERDLYNIRDQLNSEKVFDTIRRKLDDGWSTSMVEDIPAPHEQTIIKNLLLPEEFDPHNHPFARHVPDHYTSFEGRALYFILDPVFEIKWDRALNWSFIGELFASSAIREQCQGELDDILRKEFKSVNQYDRRMGKKERDLAEREGRDEKLSLCYEHLHNELAISAEPIEDAEQQ